MSKFKVGDKVKIICENDALKGYHYSGNLKKGDIFVVGFVTFDGYDVRSVEEADRAAVYIKTDWVELVTEGCEEDLSFTSKELNTLLLISILHSDCDSIRPKITKQLNILNKSDKLTKLKSEKKDLEQQIKAIELEQQANELLKAATELRESL